MWPFSFALCFFFFNDTATTEIYTLSLHDALPISGPCRGPRGRRPRRRAPRARGRTRARRRWRPARDRKSTRLNSSHLVISYAVFCLKKKKKKNTQHCIGELQHLQSDCQLPRASVD